MKRCNSYSGYSVNDRGEVFSHRFQKPIDGNKKGTTSVIDYSRIKKLSPFITKKGYGQVQVSMNDGKIKCIGVHVLVADAFIGIKPDGQIVRHLDDNKSNNHPSNLAYGSLLDNVADRKRNGGYVGGAKHISAKLSNSEASAIRQLRKNKVKVKELAEMYNVSSATIESIIYNKSYKV